MSTNASSPPEWRTARACADGTCAQARRSGDKILFRNSTSKNKILRFTPAEWNDFLAGVQLGDFD